MTAKNESSFQSLEKLIWVVDQLEQYRKFSVVEFGEKFYGKKFKTRDLLPFVQKIINSNYLGLNSLKAPYIEKEVEIDDEGKKIIADKSLDRKGFFTLPENAVIDNIKFGESDLLIEAIIKKMSQTPYINPLFTQVSMQKLETKIDSSPADTSKMDQSNKPDSRLISNRIVYHFSEYEEIDDKLKSNLSKILQSFPNDGNEPKSYVITFHYKKLDGKKKTETILPLRLINYQGKWSIIGLNMQEIDKSFNLKKIMQFRVARMEDICINNKYHIVSDENEKQIDEILSRNFGIGIGESNQSEAKIKFTGDVAKMIAEIKWHPNQLLTMNPDGSAIISLKYPIDLSNELIGRVLRYGRYAQILEPKDLRRQWKAEIAEMRKLP